MHVKSHQWPIVINKRTLSTHFAPHCTVNNLTLPKEKTIQEDLYHRKNLHRSRQKISRETMLPMSQGMYLGMTQPHS